MLQSHFSIGLLEAGCDEVGVGCLAGPVVAAAVILPKGYYHPGLKDSKQLTPRQRQTLSKLIQKKALGWAIGEASPEEIDQINILNATYLAMHRAISQLQLVPELLLVDGNRFRPYPAIAHQCIIKGDAKLASIAAASILAKTYRDSLMYKLAKMFPGYGWESNVGYPTLAHRKAIQELGVSPYHRKSFQLISKLGQLAEVAPLHACNHATI